MSFLCSWCHWNSWAPLCDSIGSQIPSASFIRLSKLRLTPIQTSLLISCWGEGGNRLFHAIASERREMESEQDVAFTDMAQLLENWKEDVMFV